MISQHKKSEEHIQIRSLPYTLSVPTVKTAGNLHQIQNAGPLLATAGLQVQSQTDLHRQLQATLYYRTRSYLKKHQNIN